MKRLKRTLQSTLRIRTKGYPLHQKVKGETQKNSQIDTKRHYLRRRQVDVKRLK